MTPSSSPRRPTWRAARPGAAPFSLVRAIGRQSAASTRRGTPGSSSTGRRRRGCGHRAGLVDDRSVHLRFIAIRSGSTPAREQASRRLSATRQDRHRSADRDSRTVGTLAHSAAPGREDDGVRLCGRPSDHVCPISSRALRVPIRARRAGRSACGAELTEDLPTRGDSPRPSSARSEPVISRRIAWRLPKYCRSRSSSESARATSGASGAYGSAIATKIRRVELARPELLDEAGPTVTAAAISRHPSGAPSGGEPAVDLIGREAPCERRQRGATRGCPDRTPRSGREAAVRSDRLFVRG